MNASGAAHPPGQPVAGHGLKAPEAAYLGTGGTQGEPRASQLSTREDLKASAGGH